MLQLWYTNEARNSNRIGWPWPDFVEMRESLDSFSELAAYVVDGANLGGVERPDRVQVMRTTSSLFPLLGGSAARGLTFTPQDDSPAAPPVAMLAYRRWRDSFGGDPDIVGRTLLLDGEPVSVIGVMPEGFWFQSPAIDLWVPLAATEEEFPRGYQGLRVIGRLDDEADAEGARAEIESVARRLAHEYPDTNSGFNGASVESLVESFINADMRRSLYLLLGTGVFVFLIACVNVANLQLARGAARGRELAVRTALGAGRVRLLRQQLTEGILLALSGSVLGTVMFRPATEWLSGTIPSFVPRADDYVTFDGAVLTFTLAASLGSVILFGLAPALRATSGHLNEGLKDAGRTGAGGRRGRLQSGLVIVEISLALVLLIGAGLLVRSYLNVQQRSPGFDPNGLITLRVVLPEAQYEADEEVRRYFDAALDAVATTPGITHASAVSALPAGTGRRFFFATEDEIPTELFAFPAAIRAVIDQSYVETMGITILRGRDLDVGDTETTDPVVLINETLSRQLWPGENPIGKRLTTDVLSLRGKYDAPIVWHTIVGVVADVANQGKQNPALPEIYFPFAQQPERTMNFVARASGDAAALGETLRTRIQAIDRGLPPFSVATMREVLRDRYWGETITIMLLAGSAIGALLLAIVGIYGVITHAVSQQTHEFGVRMALGAAGGDVLRMVLLESCRLAAIGMAIGIVGAFGLSRFLSFMLFEVSASDPLTFVGIAVALGAVAVIASLIPARRAAAVDPMIALRAE